MAALERIDMLRQPIEIFRRANFSENTSLRGNVEHIAWLYSVGHIVWLYAVGHIVWLYEFYTVLPKQGYASV